MVHIFHRQILNTRSLFWRIYEIASAVIGYLLLVLLFIYMWNALTSAYGMKPFYEEFLTKSINVVFKILLFIIALDIIKFIISRSPKDNPFRKWFSFRWAQKYKPDEVFFYPEDYKGDYENFIKTKCHKCGVTHLFGPQEKYDRVCSFYSCNGIVHVPDLSAIEHLYIGEESNFLSGKEDSSKNKKGENLTGERVSGDIFDEIEFFPFRLILKHSWIIAEYAFKLTTWMVLASAVTAYGQKLENHLIIGLGLFLSATWVAALAAILFKLTGFMQDAAYQKWVHRRPLHPILTTILSSSVAIVISFPIMNVFFILIDIFTEIFRQGGLN